MEGTMSMTAEERQTFLDKYLQEQRDRLRQYQESLGLVEQVEALTSGSPEKQLTEAVQRRMNENPRLGYATALREVSREQPALYEQYRQAVKSA
jgi:hypothetical protein